MYFWNAGIALVMLLEAGVTSLVMKEGKTTGLCGDVRNPSAIAPYGSGSHCFLSLHLPHCRAFD